MAQFEIHSLGRAKLAGKCNVYIVRPTVFNNMNPIGTTTLAEFTARAKGIREIRNTQITDAEIDLLIEGRRKPDSTIINIVSARLQQVAEESGGAPNWCVFSSWLGPSHTPQENYSISEEDRWKNKINASILYTPITYTYNYSVPSI